MNCQIKSMSPYEWLLLVILSIVWGGSFYFVGVAVEVLPSLSIVALRVSLAALALLAAVYITGLKMPSISEGWLAFACMGLLNNLIPFSLIVWGQTYIASGLASILNATTPLFTIVMAHFLTRDEKMTRLKVTGVAIGLTGVVIMLGFEVFAGIGDRVLAQFAVLGAAVSYSLAGIYGRRFGQLGVEPLVTAAGQVTASSLLLIPLAVFHDQPFTLEMPGVEVWLAIFGLALISTAFAYILYFRLLSTAGATNVLLVTLLVPVSAILFGTVFLGERLESKHLLGMSLIGIGLLSIDGRAVQVLLRKIRMRQKRHQI